MMKTFFRFFEKFLEVTKELKIQVVQFRGYSSVTCKMQLIYALF